MRSYESYSKLIALIQGNVSSIRLRPFQNGMFKVTELGKIEKSVHKNTAGHKFILTQCPVTLDSMLFIACQTLFGSRGFLGWFWP